MAYGAAWQRGARRRNFFDSRRPYLDKIGASRVLPDFCIDVLDRAGANDMDVTRVQEVLRYNDG